jgi:hypothetical protein
MKWDSELAALAVRVRQAFGRRALADAYIRVLEAALHEDCSPELEELAVAAQDANITIVDGTASADSLKKELRRMLAVH